MINDHDMPTWRLITLKKKLGAGAAIYLFIYFLKWYFAALFAPKRGKPSLY
jgi:hypothetical protein